MATVVKYLKSLVGPDVDFNLGDVATIVDEEEATSQIAAGVAEAVPVVTGSRGANAALADLLTKLATAGIIVDGTTG